MPTMGERTSDVFNGGETEEERKAKAIAFLKICGFTSTTCCKCGKQVDPRTERLMQCARCHIAHYCSMKCVQRDFEEHREACLLALEFGSFLPPEEPPKDDIPKPVTPESSLDRRKPKSASSTKSLDEPTVARASVPRKSKSLYMKPPGNEPILAKPPRVKKSKSTLSNDQNLPSDDAKDKDAPKKSKAKTQESEPTKTQESDDGTNKPKETTTIDKKSKREPKQKQAEEKNAHVDPKPDNLESNDGHKKSKESAAVDKKSKREPKQKQPAEVQAEDKNATVDLKTDSLIPNSDPEEAKPKKTRKSLRRSKSSDEVFSPSCKPQRAKLRRNKSIDTAVLPAKTKSLNTNNDTIKKLNRVDFGVGGLPKRVEDEPADKSKKDRNSLSGGRFEITIEGDVKQSVRNLIANDGQCCYCGKVVPKHLMLQCARCKLAHYCKMNCLQEDFSLHREICNFVVEYADYATIVDVDYSGTK